MSAKTRTVGARELRTRLGTYLRQVRDGATIVVTERGTPVAELRPVDLGPRTVGEGLSERVARGVLSGEMQGRPSLAPFAPVEARGASLSEAVLEDRADRL